MNVYQQISHNKLRTYLILFLFIALLSGLFYLIGQFFGDPTFFFLFGFVFSLASGIFSYFNSDKIVLAMSGAKPARKEDYFDYYTTTENLAIAAGITMPKLYVIEDEAPNAFATGRDPKHAVVVATTGLLKRLDRSDIEGVIAHELSHIRNYDILVMSIVTVLVGTAAFAADFAMRSIWFSGRSRNRNSNPVMFLVLIVALILVPITATLIQLAVSRRREYLADASGTLLTRNPEGLASALEKISLYPSAMKRASGATAHLYISNPLKRGKKKSLFANLFSTHPPVEERIAILRGIKGKAETETK